MTRSIKWIIFLGMVAVVPILLQNFAPSLLGRAILVGIFAILVVGFDLSVGYGGLINLGFQGFFAVGAYTTAVLTAKNWVPGALSEPLFAMLVGCILSVVICFIISKPVLRTTGFFVAMVTLAFGMIFYTVANGWDFLGGASGIGGIPRFHIGSFVFATDLWYYYAVWTFTAVVIVLSLRMVNSRWGIALRAVHGDEIAAEVTGVNVAKYKMDVFLVSAIFASVAGSLFAHQMRGVIPSLFTFNLLLLVTLALFFGGHGTIWGGIVGAILVQGLPEGVTALAEFWPWVNNTRELLYGIIFVAIIYLMPGGVFGEAGRFFAGRGRPVSTNARVEANKLNAGIR